VTITPVTDIRQTSSTVVRTGSLVDYLPSLYADDIVYAAGPPPLVAAVTEIAKASGTTWYADAFVPSTEHRKGLLSRAANWLVGTTHVSPRSTLASQLRR